MKKIIVALVMAPALMMTPAQAEELQEIEPLSTYDQQDMVQIERKKFCNMYRSLAIGKTIMIGMEFSGFSEKIPGFEKGKENFLGVLDQSHEEWERECSKRPS